MIICQSLVTGRTMFEVQCSTVQSQNSVFEFDYQKMSSLSLFDVQEHDA